MPIKTVIIDSVPFVWGENQIINMCKGNLEPYCVCAVKTNPDRLAIVEHNRISLYWVEKVEPLEDCKRTKVTLKC